MITCNTCGTRISDMAVKCPKCGADPRGPADSYWQREERRIRREAAAPPPRPEPTDPRSYPRAQVRQIEKPIERQQAQPERRSGQVVAVCRKHWACYILPGLFAFSLAVGFLQYIFSGEPGLALTYLILLGVIILAVYISYYYNYLEMTEDRVIAHKGALKTAITSMPIDKIQHVTMQNGIIGKLFGYDTITIVNAGSGSLTMSCMGNAQVFAELINTRIDKGQRVFF